MSWGNGFTINQTLIQQYNLSDPSGFFEDITNVTALTSHTILSVHVYGPNITVRRHLLHFKADPCSPCMMSPGSCILRHTVLLASFAIDERCLCHGRNCL